MISFSLKRRVTTFMIYIAATLFGVMSLSSIPLELMPSIEIPVAFVQTTYSGVAPTEMENIITRPLEQSIASVSGIETISSTSSEGVSIVIAQFADSTDIDTAITEMRESVDMISGYLPDGASTPIVMGYDLDSMPVVQFSVSGTESISRTTQIVEDSIIPNLERLDGVASVSISGGYENEVSIYTDSAKMNGYGLSIDYIANILRATNISIPSGQIEYGSKTLTVKTDSEFSNVSDISNTVIPLQTGGTILLSEVADVVFEPKEITTISKVNGAESIIVSVSKQSGVNTSQTAKAVVAELEHLQNTMSDVTITTLMDQAEFIDLSLEAVLTNLLLSIVFAIIVLFVFLRRISPTLIIATSMPVCIIVTFLIMMGLDLTLNMMTLGGMALGVGMIVDNSVVVLENIYRFREEGHEKLDACLNGAKEVAVPIAASTLTTIAVFLPIGVSGGMVGEIFNEFSLTITSLLIASLLIALTLVPLLCYLFLSKKATKIERHTDEKGDAHDNTSGKSVALYQKILRAVIKKSKTSLAVAFVLFFVFLSSVAFTGAELMPAVDQGTINVSISLPISSELDETVSKSEEVVEKIKDIPEIEEYYYNASDNASTVTINLVDMGERSRSVFEVGDEIALKVKDIAGAEISVSDAGTMTMTSGGAPISFTISGPDLDTLTSISNELVNQIEQIEGSLNPQTSASERVEFVSIDINEQIAASYGLTTASIGTAVASELNGVTSTTLKIDGMEVDVVVKGSEYSGTSIDALNSVLLSAPTGAKIPVSQVADVKVELGPNSIARQNQARTVTITSDIINTDLMTFNTKLNALLESYPFPDGYNLDIGGEAQDIADTFGDLGLALAVSILLVYFILASQFESILLPAIIMLATPLGLAGGIFGLFVTGTPVSMPAFIGVIMLSGIIVNNSIVLIDYIQIRQAHGEDILTAILHACPLRVRPVLMTTLTTILGLVPMALGIGEGTEMMAPMAITMISGLVISTAITLVFTPVFYYVIKKPRNRKKKLKGAENNA